MNFTLDLREAQLTTATYTFQLSRTSVKKKEKGFLNQLQRTWLAEPETDETDLRTSNTGYRFFSQRYD